MNRLSLRNNQLKFKTARKLPIILEESTEYTQFNKGKAEHVHSNRLDLQTLGSRLIMPKKSPQSLCELHEIHILCDSLVTQTIELQSSTRKWPSILRFKSEESALGANMWMITPSSLWTNTSSICRYDKIILVDWHCNFVFSFLEKWVLFFCDAITALL
jgi:hypothetical protein